MNKKVIGLILVSSLIILYFSTARAARATKAVELTSEQKKQKEALEKSPRSIFLVKSAKIDSDIGGPQFSPAEAQLRTVIDDPALHNFKKYQ
jgi:hypothetical protein